MNDSSLINKDLTNKMRLFISGSAPLSSIDHQDFYQKTGYHIRALWNDGNEYEYV